MDLETYGINAFMVTEQQQQQMERELQSRGGLRDTNSKDPTRAKAHPSTSNHNVDITDIKEDHSVRLNGVTASSSSGNVSLLVPNPLLSQNLNTSGSGVGDPHHRRRVSSALSTFIAPGGTDNPFMLTTAAAEATEAEITASANANAELAASANSSIPINQELTPPPLFPSGGTTKSRGKNLSARIESALPSGLSTMTEGISMTRPLTSASKHSNFSVSGGVSSPPPRTGGISPLSSSSSSDTFDFSVGLKSDNVVHHHYFFLKFPFTD